MVSRDSNRILIIIFLSQIVLGIVQFFVVSLGGLAIGVIFGALTSIITKYTEHCRGRSYMGWNCKNAQE